MKEMANAGILGDEVSDESIFGSEKVEDLLEKRQQSFQKLGTNRSFSNIGEQSYMKGGSPGLNRITSR